MEQKRIFMWYTPRSLSSCFLRAVANKSNTKVINEPYFCYFSGAECESPRYEKNEEANVHAALSYKDAKATLEQEYPDKTCIFTKGAAITVGEKRTIADVMPKDYIHTFILRRPDKAVLSMYKMNTTKNIPNWDFFVPSEMDYKYMDDVYEYVTTQLKQEAIVVEADDLLENPEGVLRLFCEKTGIEYEDGMVNWEHPIKDMEPFEGAEVFAENAIAHSGFAKPGPFDEKAVSELPDDVKKLIEHNQPYYDRLFPVRLVPK